MQSGKELADAQRQPAKVKTGEARWGAERMQQSRLETPCERSGRV